MFIFLLFHVYNDVVVELCGRTGCGVFIHWGLCEGRDEEREGGEEPNPDMGRLSRDGAVQPRLENVLNNTNSKDLVLA